MLLRLKNLRKIKLDMCKICGYNTVNISLQCMIFLLVLSTWRPMLRTQENEMLKQEMHCSCFDW